MAEDPEVAAMSSVAGALNDLDDGERTRVIEWAAKKYGVALSALPRKALPQTAVGTQTVGAEPPEYDDFVDFFDATSPSSDADRALVSAYWFQQVKSQPSFDSQQVNNALKDVGHGVSNITQALTSLQKRKPALVRQMAKSGKTRQARKTYKLTSAGLVSVAKMLSQVGGDNEE